MTYNYVTVSGTFATLTGTVTFTPPNDVTDLTGTIPVLGPGPFSCTVSGGSFTSAALLGTDNVGLLPAGWTCLATVALTGQKAYSYPVLIPAANGTTATLSALAVSASGGGRARESATSRISKPTPDHTFGAVKIAIIEKHGLHKETLIFLEDSDEPVDESACSATTPATPASRPICTAAAMWRSPSPSTARLCTTSSAPARPWRGSRPGQPSTSSA